MTPAPAGPPTDCALCPRLVAFRARNRTALPDHFNAPVPPFEAAGGIEATQLLVVGLAPGLHGANRTGRPFTGDYAGDLLYATLSSTGWARGTYDRRADDGLRLANCRVTNAVRCVPPENKPTGTEVRTCNRFLAAEIAAMPGLAAILALGRVAHDAVLAALGLRKVDWPFAHGGRHQIPGGPILVSSYHCSRYNTNTGRLTPQMFRAVVDSLPPP